MSTRFGPGNSTRIWDHLNALDQDLIDAAASRAALQARVEALEPQAPVVFNTSSPAGSGWYRRLGGDLVEIHWESTGTIAGQSTATPFTLPAGFRPGGMTALGSSTLASTRPAAATVNAAGQLVVYNWNSSAAVAYAHGIFRAVA